MGAGFSLAAGGVFALAGLATAGAIPAWWPASLRIGVALSAVMLCLVGLAMIGEGMFS